MNASNGDESFFPTKRTTENGNDSRVKLSTLASNYFKFEMIPNKPVIKYSIKLTPEIPDDSVELRKKIVRKFRPELAKKLGHYIHTNLQILSHNDEDDIILRADVEEKEYEILLKKTNTITNHSDPDLLQVYSHLFRQYLYANNFIRIRRKCFDSKSAFHIKEHGLEIWPGFTHSVNTINNQTLLLISPTYKVLRKDTALDVLNKLRSGLRNNNNQEFEREALKLLKGATVVTKYNNDRTYQIFDIDFQKTPADSFTTKDGEVTYGKYFKDKYDKNIQDRSQPLLKAKSPFTRKGKEDEFVYLVPELCFMTGLTEEMRANFQLMSEMNKITKVNAAKKIEECRKSIQSILGAEKSKEIAANWGTISQAPIVFKGKKLQAGNIVLKDSQFSADENLDFSRKIQRLLKSQPDITECRILFAESDRNEFNNFFNKYLQESNKIYQFFKGKPKTDITVQRHSVDNWVKVLTTNDFSKDQLLILIIDGKRGKINPIYNAVKSILVSKIPIPSQVILNSTLKRDKNLQSITNNIIVQICPKVGGSAWEIDGIPPKFQSVPTMVIGLDHFMNKNKEKIVGFTSSFERSFTKQYPLAVIDRPGIMKELVHEAIANFAKRNKGKLPEYLVIFHNGIVLNKFEEETYKNVEGIKAVFNDFKEELAKEGGNKSFKLTYILINKKMDIKLFEPVSSNNFQNAGPGTVVEETLIEDNTFAYHLVAQNSRETVSPYYYKVTYDDSEVTSTDIQLLSLKLCHLYYNWPGAIKIPTPVKNAHKMASFIGGISDNFLEVDKRLKERNSAYFL